MDSPNYFEFSVKKKVTAATRLSQFLVVLGSFTPMIVMGSIRLEGLAYLMIIFFLQTIISIWFFMRSTKKEYESIISSGDMNFAVIYDNLQRRKLLNAKIKDMTEIAPYEERYYSNALKDVKKRYDLCMSLDSDDVYFFTYNDEKNGKIFVTFNITKKAAQIMRFYNNKIIQKENYKI